MTADLVTLVSLLSEVREHITDKPWDDPSYLHKRISEALGLPIHYKDWDYSDDCSSD